MGRECVRGLDRRDLVGPAVVLGQLLEGTPTDVVPVCDVLRDEFGIDNQSTDPGDIVGIELYLIPTLKGMKMSTKSFPDSTPTLLYPKHLGIPEFNAGYMAKVDGNDGHSMSNRRRRDFLAAAGGAAGIVGFAGCIGDDDDVADVELQDPDTTDVEIEDDEAPPEEPEEPTFILPTTDNPETASFVGGAGRGQMRPDFDEQAPGPLEPPHHVWSVLREPAVWGRVHSRAYIFSPGEIEPGIIESWEIDDETMTLHMRDDIYWSDGEPVTALDGGVGRIMYRIGEALYGPDGNMLLGPRGEGGVAIYVDGVRFPDGHDGKTVEYFTTHEGYVRWQYEEGSPGYLFTANLDDTLGVFPTHIEPYDEVAEHLIEIQEQGLAGEPVPHWNEVWEQHIEEDHFEYFRDPDNVLSHGAWQLDEIRGAEEFVLTPNEYHRRADEMNIAELRMPWIEEDHRLHAELQAGRPDWASTETPEELIDGLTETYDDEIAVLNQAFQIGFNQNKPIWEDVEVRQAVGFALDSELIANTFHTELSTPVTTPGGDWIGRPAWVSDEWVDENLIDYSQDLDRAEELMFEAGYEREGGTWLHEGDPIEFVFPTDNPTPDWEISVVDQLNEFGFEGTVQSMEDDAFWDAKMAGEFDIFKSTYWEASLVLFGYARFATQVSSLWAHEAYGIWDGPDADNLEAIEETVETYGRHEFVADEHELYYEMPPIGEPDGERELVDLPQINADYMYRSIDDMRGREETVPLMIWAYNWGLPTLQLFYPGQHFLYNNQDFDWPTDHHTWEYLGWGVDETDYLSSGLVTAD